MKRQQKSGSKTRLLHSDTSSSSGNEQEIFTDQRIAHSPKQTPNQLLLVSDKNEKNKSVSTTRKTAKPVYADKADTTTTRPISKQTADFPSTATTETNKVQNRKPPLPNKPINTSDKSHIKENKLSKFENANPENISAENKSKHNLRQNLKSASFKVEKLNSKKVADEDAGVTAKLIVNDETENTVGASVQENSKEKAQELVVPLSAAKKGEKSSAGSDKSTKSVNQKVSQVSLKLNTTQLDKVSTNETIAGENVTSSKHQDIPTFDDKASDFSNKSAIRPKQSSKDPMPVYNTWVDIDASGKKTTADTVNASSKDLKTESTSVDLNDETYTTYNKVSAGVGHPTSKIMSLSQYDDRRKSEILNNSMCLSPIEQGALRKTLAIKSSESITFPNKDDFSITRYKKKSQEFTNNRLGSQTSTKSVPHKLSPFVDSHPTWSRQFMHKHSSAAGGVHSETHRNKSDSRSSWLGKSFQSIKDSMSSMRSSLSTTLSIDSDIIGSPRLRKSSSLRTTATSLATSESLTARIARHRFEMLSRIANFLFEEQFINDDDHLKFLQSTKRRATVETPEPVIAAIKLEVYPILVDTLKHYKLELGIHHKLTIELEQQVKQMKAEMKRIQIR